MTANLRNLLIKVLQAANELPEGLRAREAEVIGCEESCFDETYIAFLGEMIQLSPRGPEWTERLKRRRAALAPFCGIRLIDAHVRAGTSGFWIKVDPATKQVVHWEEYPDEFRGRERE